jgi:hypothetical protein
LWLSSRLCRGGAGAVYVPQRLASWRAHTANLSRVLSPARSEENVYLYRVLVADPELGSIQRELRRAYAGALWTVATRNLRFGSRRRAIQSAATAAMHGNYKAGLLILATVLPKRLLPGTRAG